MTTTDKQLNRLMEMLDNATPDEIEGILDQLDAIKAELRQEQDEIDRRWDYLEDISDKALQRLWEKAV